MSSSTPKITHIDWQIDPDIRVAETLPARFYTDEQYFHLSKERIFSKTWQLAALADDVANLLPVNLLENFLDEPLLFSKGSETQCLSNVCTHRGKILVEEPCEANGIRCRYHGRRFGLSGEFRSMPEFDGVVDFPSERDNLTKVPFGEWGKFLFASIDPAALLDEFISPMRERLSGIDFENLKLVSTRDYEVGAHWALYCENYLEGFHIPFVHQSLNTAIDYGSYTTETFRFSSLQTGFSPEPSRSSSPLFDHGAAAYYFFVFPSMMFNFYPWGLSLNIVKPQTPERTIVSYLTFVSDASLIETGAGSNLDRVELEDQAVVESVQKGLKSRFYDRGRYSPTKEQGTHHFHRLITEFLGQ